MIRTAKQKNLGILKALTYSIYFKSKSKHVDLCCSQYKLTSFSTKVLASYISIQGQINVFQYDQNVTK
jgi:hypothetical protein